MNLIRRQLIIHGRVQGVGFRFFAYAQARRFNVKGFVRNLPGNRVESQVEGREQDVLEYTEALRKGPPLAEVEKIEIIPQPYTNEFTDFEIRH